jgi:hypothetical protein
LSTEIGYLSSKIKDFKRAAGFFADAAEQLKNEPKLAHESYELGLSTMNDWATIEALLG